ncbi:MAG TPA: DUF4301 family protein [Bacteroidales bacterium]|nr:DUF4301 family protein [Bacteroidales bacterium]
MLKEKDIEQLTQKGISENQVINQLDYFRKGFPVLTIAQAATIENGIKHLGEPELRDYIALYDTERAKRKIVKFVPASGAATRMFKSLFEYLDTRNLNQDTEEVLYKLNSFAFYEELKATLLKKNIRTEDSDKPDVRLMIIDHILNPSGLNYGNLPKGLIKFHLYEEGIRTAFEEHLVEGIFYASGQDDVVNIHFTVSPEHRGGFMQLLDHVREDYEEKYNVTIDVSFSEQKPSTDTVAVDINNEPFRDKNGNMLFRPGGHGALLDNLNDTDADIIFIKNIDNVVPDKLKAPTITYKKALAGLLISLQNSISHYLEVLATPESTSLEEVISFVESNLGYRFSERLSHLSDQEKKEEVIKILNRPLRVCGMVRNQGEPGGGPFWVKAKDGSLSLQILESSQFDFSIPEHKKAFQSSTHFNPVDLICSTKDRFGNPYDLHQFRDSDTGFISVKSKDGKDLKALELPGLWNGSMAFWNTVFVEVPIETFNPVKTINDLLRPQHIALLESVRL